jgi:hypothetical protein
MLFAIPPAYFFYLLTATMAVTASAVIYRHLTGPSAVIEWLIWAGLLYAAALACWPLVSAEVRPKLVIAAAKARLWAVRILFGAFLGAAAAVIAALNLLATARVVLSLGGDGGLLPWIVAIVALPLLIVVEYRLLLKVLDGWRAVVGNLRTTVAIVTAAGAIVLALVAVEHPDRLNGLLGTLFARERWEHVLWSLTALVVLGAEEIGHWFAGFNTLMFALAGGVIAVALGYSLVAGAFLALLRYHEEADIPDERSAPLAKVEEIARLEDAPGYAQNHIIAVTPMKKGWFRRLTLALAMYGIAVLVEYWCRPGFVLNMGTIHYARWLRLADTDTLLFFANYDGSWQSYLEDFVNKHNTYVG